MGAARTVGDAWANYLSSTTARDILEWPRGGFVGPQSIVGGTVHFSLLADPTIRFWAPASPRGLRAWKTGNTVNLGWEPPTVAGTVHYVYRSTGGPNGSFQILNATPTANWWFADGNPPAGPKIYMVRAERLATTGSGTFRCLSVGVFVEVTY